MYIFISYSHVDKEIIENITSIFDKLGIGYFQDVKDIQWGEKITDKVKQALDKVTHIILIISPASLKSQWVSYETGYAKAKNIIILPFLIHPSLELPSYLKDTSYKTKLSDLEQYFLSVISFSHEEKNAFDFGLYMAEAVGVGEYNKKYFETVELLRKYWDLYNLPIDFYTALKEPSLNKKPTLIYNEVSTIMKEKSGKIPNLFNLGFIIVMHGRGIRHIKKGELVSESIKEICDVVENCFNGIGLPNELQEWKDLSNKVQKDTLKVNDIWTTILSIIEHIRNELNK